MRGNKNKMNKIDKTTRSQYRTRTQEDFPENLNIGKLKFEKSLSMRYGENPGYRMRTQ